MDMSRLRHVAVFFLLSGSIGAGAGSDEILETPNPVEVIDDAAQLCFQDASNVPDFRFEQQTEVLERGEGQNKAEQIAIEDHTLEPDTETDTDTDTDTDTEILDPCALAIQNNNLSQRDLAASYSNQGLILASKGDFALAIISHTQAIALLENSEDSRISEIFYINRGNAYFAMQEYEAANADYSRAILLSSGTRHQALYNRALVFKALGYRQRALEELEHALLLDPDNPRYLASHGLLQIADNVLEIDPEADQEKFPDTF